jgi:hypothetical protein
MATCVIASVCLRAGRTMDGDLREELVVNLDHVPASYDERHLAAEKVKNLNGPTHQTLGIPSGRAAGRIGLRVSAGSV